MSARRKPVSLRNIVADMKGFDWEVYLLNHPELGLRTKEDANNHYKKIGFWEKRSCSVSDKFDAAGYMARNAHLGFRSARDAYVHFMRVGRPATRNEGLQKNIRPYRLATAPSPHRRRVYNTAPVPATPPPPLVLTPRPPPPPQPSRRAPVPKIVTIAANTPQQPKRNVKQPKPGQLVLKEPPSSYFAKICVIGPPKIVNPKDV